MHVKRMFIPGSSWMYYKIYCGARMADHILTETLKPLTENLMDNKHIDRWFFIRYSDPEFHLRIRFHMKDLKALGILIMEVHNALAPYVRDDTVHQLQIATYKREIERYGSRTIALSEDLFYHESKMLLTAMAAITDDTVYFLFILKAIDQLLNDFLYDRNEKLKLVTTNSNAFKQEFHANRSLNKQLDKKYRNLSDTLSTFLHQPLHGEYAYIDRILDQKAQDTMATVRDILAYTKKTPPEVPLSQLVSSYIHMLVNRAFRSRQRFYELLCYDFLKRYYTSRVHYPRV